jgi:hypothetical protein
MDCEALQLLLAGRQACERSEYGLRIATQCLYPSASQVFVHVVDWKDGFRVTDAGGAADCASFHGRDQGAISAGLNQASARFSLAVEDDNLVAFVPSIDWLPAAIMAVANGAAHAATVAVEHITKATEQSLKAKIRDILERSAPDRFIARDFEYVGKSGKVWHVDYALTIPSKPILMKAVTPHHNSVASNYTTFGDVGRVENVRYCVFKRRPENEDSALLRQVAELMPINALADHISSAIGTRLH